jgi:hypothetical protein
MPKGGMPRARGDPSKKPDEEQAEDMDKLGLGSPPASSRVLTIPRAGRDAAGVAATTWPTLTRTNYNTWSLLMKVILVPVEMIPMLAVKSTAKEAWDAIKMIRVGAERVRELKAQILRGQYEEIRFKAGESVDDFGLRLQ